MPPVLMVWAPRVIVTLSLAAMSVVGESNEPEGPLKLAKPEIVVSAMPLSYFPPEKSCGNVNPYEARCQKFPNGGMR